MEKGIVTPPKWDREEVVLLIVEYFRTKNLSVSDILQSQEMISKVLKKRYEKITGIKPDELFRNLNGIILQSGRIRCLDPDTEYTGMIPTRLQRQVYKEYVDNPSKLISEAYSIITRYYD